MDRTLRDDKGRFLPGTVAGPGRPLNSRPRLVVALRAALDDDSTLKKLREVAMAKMEDGDAQFWRLRSTASGPRATRSSAPMGLR